MNHRFRRARHDSGRIALAMAIILSALVVVAAGTWFAFGYFGLAPQDVVKAIESVTTASDDSDRPLETPAWEDVRRGAVPEGAADPPEPKGGEPTQVRPSRPGVDAGVIEIADNLNKQFARNPGKETAFTDAYPRRALQSWINDRAGVPADLRDHFVEALIAASQGIGEDPAINRIGSVPERVRAIQDALFAYRDEYLRWAEAVAQAEEAARAEEREKAASSGKRVSPEERDWREEAASNRFAPAKPVRPVNRGPSLAHIVVLGIGGLALVVTLLLMFMGGPTKEVRPARSAPGEQSA